MATKKPDDTPIAEDEFQPPPKRRVADIDRIAQHRAENPVRPGRKTLLTPELMETITDLLKRGNYISTAAKYVGIAPETVHSWVAKGNRLLADGRDEEDYDDTELLYRSFAQEMEKARSFAEIKAVEVIRNAMPSQWQAAAWYLERTNNREWGRTVRTEITGAEGGAVQVDVDSVYRKLEALSQRTSDAEVIEDAELESGE